MKKRFWSCFAFHYFVLYIYRKFVLNCNLWFVFFFSQSPPFTNKLFFLDRHKDFLIQFYRLGIQTFHTTKINLCLWFRLQNGDRLVPFYWVPDTVCYHRMTTFFQPLKSLTAKKSQEIEQGFFHSAFSLFQPTNPPKRIKFTPSFVNLEQIFANFVIIFTFAIA